MVSLQYFAVAKPDIVILHHKTVHVELHAGGTVVALEADGHIVSPMSLTAPVLFLRNWDLLQMTEAVLPCFLRPLLQPRSALELAAVLCQDTCVKHNHCALSRLSLVDMIVGEMVPCETVNQASYTLCDECTHIWVLDATSLNK
jgi:hypothetical protein